MGRWFGRSRWAVDSPAGGQTWFDDVHDAQVAAQLARRDLAAGQTVGLDEMRGPKMVATEKFGPTRLEGCIRDPGDEIVVDLLQQIAGRIFPAGRRGWAISVSDVANWLREAPPQRFPRQRFYPTHRAAYAAIGKLWDAAVTEASGYTDDQLPPGFDTPSVAAAGPGSPQFNEFAGLVKDAAEAQFTGLPLDDIYGFLTRPGILAGVGSDRDLKITPLRQKLPGQELIDFLARHAGAHRLQYVAAISPLVTAVVDPSQVEGTVDDAIKHVIVVLVVLGPGHHEQWSTQLTEVDGGVQTKGWELVEFGATDFTPAIDATALAEMEDGN